MRTAALVLLALAGCATLPSDAPVTGRWGGQHVGLDMGAARGSLDYDCAAGTIDGPLLLDPSGRFASRGTHTPGTGGPVEEGETPMSYPAIYSGTVRGDTMSLTVDVPATGVRIGPYQLRRDAPPILMRCL